MFGNYGADGYYYSRSNVGTAPVAWLLDTVGDAYNYVAGTIDPVAAGSRAGQAAAAAYRTPGIVPSKTLDLPGTTYTDADFAEFMQPQPNYQQVQVPVPGGAQSGSSSAKSSAIPLLITGALGLGILALVLRGASR